MKRISNEYNSVRKNQTVYGSISGNYSFRSEKTIWFESTLERDFLFKQEYNNSVIDVVSQPISIPYITELGNESIYTPDFLVQYSSAICSDLHFNSALLLIEIKPRKKLQTDWERLKPKFKAAHACASKKGWKFKIIDECRLYDQFWENIQYLRQYRRSYIPEFEKNILIETLKSLELCTVNQLSTYISKDESKFAKTIHQIWALVSKRLIACNLHSPLTTETVIWVNQNTLLKGVI